MSADVKITAEPLSVPAMCRFTVDRPVYPDRAYFFGSRESAEGSPLAERLFAIPGVVGLLISTIQKQFVPTGPLLQQLY